MSFTNVDGKIIDSALASIGVENQSYRYGYGLFETMKVRGGKIIYAARHFQRLFDGLSRLEITVPAFFSVGMLEKAVKEICQKNECVGSARVRLSISGGSGGLYDGDDRLAYLVECWPLNFSTGQINENGLVIGVYPGMKKTLDEFSNLKSANHLCYRLAAKFAKKNQWNDCLVLNTNERIADSTIANLFWVKDQQVYTPPLSEGCIAGVMRIELIERLRAGGRKVVENICEVGDLENADEIFLTNVIRGINWVSAFNGRIYNNKATLSILHEFGS